MDTANRSSMTAFGLAENDRALLSKCSKQFSYLCQCMRSTLQDLQTLGPLAFAPMSAILVKIMQDAVRSIPGVCPITSYYL